MGKALLNLKELHKLDMGKAAAMFEMELRKAVQDCDARPLDKRPRRVEMKFSIVPHVALADGKMPSGCSQVDVEMEVSSSTPKQRTQSYRMNMKQSGGLEFHEEFPDDPDQMGMFDKETGEVKE
jgi:hypothetical protein